MDKNRFSRNGHAKEYGFHVESLRHAERLGVLMPFADLKTEEDRDGYRLRCQLIAAGKAAGMTTFEIHRALLWGSRIEEKIEILRAEVEQNRREAAEFEAERRAFEDSLRTPSQRAAYRAAMRAVPRPEPKT